MEQIGTMNEAAGLILDRLGNFWVGMPKARDSDAAERVEIFVAIGIEKPDAIATFKGNRQSAIGVHQRLVVHVDLFKTQKGSECAAPKKWAMLTGMPVFGKWQDARIEYLTNLVGFAKRLYTLPRFWRCLSGGISMTTNIMDIIKEQIEGNPILLYMKGSPQQPQCGFSARTVQALMACGERFAYINILENPEIRENLKIYSNWPTFPQLYINGELVGGCDIVTELYESGELKQMISAAAKA